jgi:hypothetical protein
VYVTTISTLSGIAADDYRGLVACLGIEHRLKEARRLLMRAGTAATSELRRGLRHPDPKVRIGCCIVLDHSIKKQFPNSSTISVMNTPVYARGRCTHWHAIAAKKGRVDPRRIESFQW